MKRLLWLAATLVGAGCTLLTQFEPEGQPCDSAAPRAMQCLSGYSCGPGQRCTKGPVAGVSPVDSGIGAVDAGPPIVDAGGTPPDASTVTDGGSAVADAGSGSDGG